MDFTDNFAPSAPEDKGQRKACTGQPPVLDAQGASAYPAVNDGNPGSPRAWGQSRTPARPPGDMTEVVRMGKSYLHECLKCGYRAVVAGGGTEGNDVKVQTFRCRDCRTLQDCVIALRRNARLRLGTALPPPAPPPPPRVEAAINRLPCSPGEPREWTEYLPRCAVDPTHRIEPWQAPGRCPRCGCYMDRGPIPYRVWD